MADPRLANLPWPFVAVDEDPFMGIEIAPNEIVYVVLGGTYRLLHRAFIEAQSELDHLREQYDILAAAATEQVKAAQQVADIWRHYGHQLG